jgi:hypothetical protein
MKRSFKTMRVCMMMGFFIVIVRSALAFGPQVERSLELNGISDIPGSKCAFFILTRPDVWVSPRSFMLAEGESEFGIQLLAVETASNCVQIEQDGRKQLLHIRSPVEFSPFMISRAMGDAAKFSTQNEDGLAGNTDPNNPVSDQMAGNPGYGNLPANGSRPNPGKKPTPKQAATAISNLNGVDPANALQDQSQTEWYQESANIEQNRIETASAVLAGEMTPWPRTPLTPAGTVSALVGAETFFSSHIPGFRQPPGF